VSGAGVSPAPPRLTVRGGPGGTAARLDDLEVAAGRLREAAAAMAWVAARVVRVTADPALLAAGIRHPLTWWDVEHRLVRATAGRDGALTVAARYAALAAAALAVVTLYRTTEAGVDAAVRAADTAAGEAVGHLFGLPVLAAAAITAPALAAGVPVRPFARSVAVALAAHPDALEHGVDAAPGALRGVLGTSPLLQVLAGAGTLRPLGVPREVAGAAGWVGAVGRTTPWLREGDVVVHPGSVIAEAPPRGLADLLTGVGHLDPDRGGRPGEVQVLSVRRKGRRAWVVQIPGTQEWSPRPGRNPFDLTGDVHGLAGERTAGGRAVTAALQAAGAGPGEPVLLVGHSQGGIVAAQLAADPQFRRSFAVTHVVTAGSPVATAGIPASVSVLSLEHEHDVVPRLDGRPNPDRAGWITVSAPAERPGAPVDPAGSHDADAYARTAAAVDASVDPGLRQWRAGLAPFLGGDGATGTRMLVSAERVGRS